jgi:hypothetical protein
MFAGKVFSVITAGEFVGTCETVGAGAGAGAGLLRAGCNSAIWC